MNESWIHLHNCIVQVHLVKLVKDNNIKTPFASRLWCEVRYSLAHIRWGQTRLLVYNKILRRVKLFNMYAFYVVKTFWFILFYNFHYFTLLIFGNAWRTIGRKIITNWRKKTTITNTVGIILWYYFCCFNTCSWIAVLFFSTTYTIYLCIEFTLKL